MKCLLVLFVVLNIVVSLYFTIISLMAVYALMMLTNWVTSVLRILQ